MGIGNTLIADKNMPWKKRLCLLLACVSTSGLGEDFTKTKNK